MRHVKARLPIAHPSLTKQLATARAVLDRARSSETLGESNPQFQNFDRETEALRKADQKVELLKMDLAAAMTARDQQRARFRKAAAVYVTQVDAVAMGSAEVIVVTGLDLMRAPSASPALAAPMFYRVEPGKIDGELRLGWRRVPGAASYQVERSLEHEGPYTHAGSFTTSKVKLERQPINVGLWYRVAAVGPSGTGAYSTPTFTLLPGFTGKPGEG